VLLLQLLRREREKPTGVADGRVALGCGGQRLVQRML
jgi:hypothetical protein